MCPNIKKTGICLHIIFINLCDSHNQQKFFPCISLTGLIFVREIQSVFYEVGVEYLNVIYSLHMAIFRKIWMRCRGWNVRPLTNASGEKPPTTMHWCVVPNSPAISTAWIRYRCLYSGSPKLDSQLLWLSCLLVFISFSKQILRIGHSCLLHSPSFT